MPPWVECETTDVDLDAPLNARLDAFPDSAFEPSRALLRAVMAEIPRWVRPLAQAVRARTLNRFQAEAVALAHRAGVGWAEVMLANVSYDLVLAAFGCSTVALPTPAGPVLARNMDWWPEDLLARASRLVRFCRGGELQFANAGWPGAIGVVSGLSGRGFGVALNAVLSEERVRRTGYPVLLHLRRVVEDAEDFDAALAMLQRQKLASPALFTLVGSENQQRVVIERSPTRHALRWADDDGPLVTTNDYRLLERPHETAGAGGHTGEIYFTTCHRYEALCRHFADHRAERRVVDDELLYVLSGADVIQGITAQHVILRPRSGQARLFVPRHLALE